MNESHEPNSFISVCMYVSPCRFLVVLLFGPLLFSVPAEGQVRTSLRIAALHARPSAPPLSGQPTAYPVWGLGVGVFAELKMGTSRQGVDYTLGVDLAVNQTGQKNEIFPTDDLGNPILPRVFDSIRPTYVNAGPVVTAYKKVGPLRSFIQAGPLLGVKVSERSNYGGRLCCGDAGGPIWYGTDNYPDVVYGLTGGVGVEVPIGLGDMALRLEVRQTAFPSNPGHAYGVNQITTEIHAGITF